MSLSLSSCALMGTKIEKVFRFGVSGFVFLKPIFLKLHGYLFMVIRFLLKSLIILPFYFGAFQSKAQTKTFAVHPSVGTALTYDELEKYQIYPQYKKSAVDSLTYSVNTKGKFFLHLHFSNGVNDYLPVTKKDVYYVHDKINLFEKLNDTLIIENINPPIIRKQPSPRKTKEDSVKIKHKTNGSHLLDVQIMERMQIDGRIPLNQNFSIKNVYPDYSFSLGKIGKNIQNKTSLYFSWGVVINKSYTEEHYTDAWYHYSTVTSKIIYFGLEQKIGLITQWKRANLISTFNFSCDLLTQTKSHGSYTSITYTSTFPIHNTTTRDYRSNLIFKPIPSFDLGITFTYNLSKKPRTPYLNISSRLGYFYYERLSVFATLGGGIGLKF